MLIVYDKLYAEHLKGIPHPESPDRVETVAAFLREHGIFDEGTAPRARDASDEEIERVHGDKYVRLVEEEVVRMRGHAGYVSTGDTVIDEHSMQAARRAAGAAIVAAQTAWERRVPSFALIRPPGHHAEPARGMGFCLFNNASIAARAIQALTGSRVLIADFDYHHGNGTQSTSGSGLSYVSTHGYPAYPGTGGPNEQFPLDRDDVIVNLPLPAHGVGSEAFVAAWNALLPRVAQHVRPDMLLISAGFDYVRGDPVGDLGVDLQAARDLAAVINQTAQTFCEGRVAYILEGGYIPEVIAQSIAAIADAHASGAEPSRDADFSALPAPAQRIMGKIAGMLA